MNDHLQTPGDEQQWLIGCLNRKELGVVLQFLEERLGQLKWPRLKARADEIKADYDLMVHYWAQDLNDPHFVFMYDKMLRQTADIVMEMTLRIANTADGHLIEGWDKEASGKGIDWSWTAVRQRLENFVASVALADLEEEGSSSPRLNTIYEEHQKYRKLLFKRIVSGYLLGKEEIDDLASLLVTPTIDTIDQQLIVAAFSLSAMRAIDVNKLALLHTVYATSTDEWVRQRALLGLALSMGTDMDEIFPEVAVVMGFLLGDDVARKELEELQIQIIYCLEAPKDGKEIEEKLITDRHIIQDILGKEGSFRMGILDEDSVDDIINPGESERKMEHIEATARRMMDMDKQGRDLYFGGFSRMKAFPFFDDVSNWFVPFFKEHPDIAGVSGDNSTVDKAMKMMGSSPFCDSDRYSFLLVMRNIINNMPPQLADILDKQIPTDAGDAFNGMQAAAIRRNLLQGMFRFFKLYKYKASFQSPFELKTDYEPQTASGPLFLLDRLLARGMSPFMLRMVRILDEHGFPFIHIRRIFNIIEKNTDDYDYNMAYARTAVRHGMAPREDYTAEEAYANALKVRPGSKAAKKGLARTLFRRGNFDEAYRLFGEMLSDGDSSLTIRLSMAACLSNMGDQGKALDVLYKMDYDRPEESAVRSMLARVLMESGKTQKALDMLAGVQAEGKLSKTDFKNLLLCKWILHKGMADVVKGLCSLCKEAGARANAGWEDIHAFEAVFDGIVDQRDCHVLEMGLIAPEGIGLMKSVVWRALCGHEAS